jgi:hypothetical protein
MNLGTTVVRVLYEILYYNTYIQTALQNESGGQAGGGKFNKKYERGGVWAEMKGGAVPIYYCSSKVQLLY